MSLRGNKPSLLKHDHNPSAQLLNILLHKLKLLKRFKRIFSKDRYDIGGI